MTKIISLTNEVYNELKRLKKDKSFSKQIKELMEKSEVKNSVTNLRQFLGLWGESEAKLFLKEVEKSRRNAKQRYFT